MSKVIWKPGTFIYPLPVVMVSCGTMEKSNIITVAWTGIINSDKPMCYISVRKEKDKCYVELSEDNENTYEEKFEINDLKSNVISVGQQLKVIVGKDNAIPIGSSCYGEGYVEPKYITYTVKKGDSLYVIAKKYNVSVDSIKALNDLKDNNLSIGQILKIKEVS